MFSAPAYILPKKGISKSASQVTGITTSGGELLKDGKLLRTTPPKKAFQDFIAFLKSKGERVVLIAHNGFRYSTTSFAFLIISYRLEIMRAKQ